jgi:zinc/manganese transport system substrate-binding protein
MVYLRYMRRCLWLGLGVIVCLGGLSACGSMVTATTQGANGQVIQVVAAENFYGNLASQLGGRHVAVTSILSDPNVDPHEYQTNTNAAITVSKADLVIENSGGYDDWMDKLLESAPKSSRLLLKGFESAPTHLPENEHVWYSLDNMTAIAEAITADLKKLDAADAAAFESNLHVFKQTLQPLQAKIAAIRAKYNGTPVGLTETIYLYQAEPEGLKVLTPFAFEKAIAEGNDPPAGAVVTTTDQITRRQVKVLIYNQQTVTPVTTNLMNQARAQHIPLVPVTETMPAGKTYQTWMLDQLNTLQTALGG